MSNEKYTKEQLESTKVAVLREILASKAGTPSNKPKDVLIKEILDEQEGLVVFERGTKGRRRLTGVEPYKPDAHTSFTFNTPKPELVEEPQNYYKEDLNYSEDVVNVVAMTVLQAK